MRDEERRRGGGAAAAARREEDEPASATITAGMCRCRSDQREHGWPLLQLFNVCLFVTGYKNGRHNALLRRLYIIQ